VGRDAGELCGAAATGVQATGTLDDVLALRPDCVLYMGDRLDVDVLCALLESGANVVATRGELTHPADLPADVRSRLEAACRAGGSSLHGTGSSPGFITEALPIVLLSLQRRLHGLAIDEFAVLSSRNSPELLFGVMGFGKPPEAFEQRRWAHGAAAFGPSLRGLAETVGLPLDAVESTGEVAVAAEDLSIAAGTIARGTVAAQRMVVTGMRGGTPLLRLRANWYCSDRLDADWELRATGWRVVVDGDAPLDVAITFPVPDEHYAATSPAYTANRPVNAIPYVCAAAPGIRTTAELPQIVANLGATR